MWRVFSCEENKPVLETRIFVRTGLGLPSGTGGPGGGGGEILYLLPELWPVYLCLGALPSSAAAIERDQGRAGDFVTRKRSTVDTKWVEDYKMLDSFHKDDNLFSASSIDAIPVLTKTAAIDALPRLIKNSTSCKRIGGSSPSRRTKIKQGKSSYHLALSMNRRTLNIKEASDRSNVASS